MAMYEEFYELDKTPFIRGLPTESLYMTDELEEILMRLKYVAQRQLFAVVTGDCGTGKTTLLRKFKNEIDSNHYKFLYISDSKLTPRNFYRQLHREIEIMKGVLNYRNSIVREVIIEMF